MNFVLRLCQTIFNWILKVGFSWIIIHDMRCCFECDEDPRDRYKPLQDDARNNVIQSQPRSTRTMEELEKENRALLRILTPELRTKFESENLQNAGVFEDMSDKYSNTKLKERFNRIHGTEWLSLYLSIKEHYDDELTIIEFISDIMKDVYEDCKLETDKRLKDLGDGCTIPSTNHFSDVYSFRKAYGQTEDALKELKVEAFKVIKLKTKQMYNIQQSARRRSNSLDSITTESRKRYSSDAANRKLLPKQIEKWLQFSSLSLRIISNPDILNAFESFLDAFVECSWLMLISEQPIELYFDILGKIWETSIEERFEKYSTNDSVIDWREINTIKLIVWPELDDKHGIHARGSVVTVDINRDTEV